jgi:CheY-like chemotaxis protein
VQAVANILNNAAKYTPPAGTIRIALVLEDGRARLQVRDNGSGMPPDLLPSVFELFTQGARTLARSQGGLGLGLALVKKLVEMHGGAVAAHSDGVGLGSVFTIELPCAHGDGDAGPDGASVQPAGAAAYRPLRVIVVDDNEDAADSLATLLRAQGHTVAVDYTASGALRRARREMPDAMVVDIGLPDMDGYQLGALLREEPATRGAVLIAATGYGGEQDRARARDAGFAHHLVKPVDMAALVRILQDTASALRP